MASFDYNTFCCNLCIVDVSLTNYYLQRKNTEYNILPQSILVVVVKLGHHANALLWQEACPGVCFHQISAVALWETLSFHCTTGEVVLSECLYSCPLLWNVSIITSAVKGAFSALYFRLLQDCFTRLSWKLSCCGLPCLGHCQNLRKGSSISGWIPHYDSIQYDS